jgi:hypothetical protein
MNVPTRKHDMAKNSSQNGTGLSFLISLARSMMTSSNRSPCLLALADGTDHHVMFAKHNAPQ